MELLCGRQSTVYIEDGEKSSKFMWNKVSLEQPTVPTAGDARYLTRLWVSETEEPWELHYRPNSSQSITTGIELRPEKIFTYHQEITYKIRSALKQLTFREQHVLVQFWSPRVVGKHQLLTTIDQPFGLGIAVQELFLYRRECEHSAYLVDKDHEDRDINPPARVFRRGLPEWTFDITNYNPKDFPQQNYAIRCNLYGYLALPVFDSTTGLCVGVLELMMSSKYMSYAFEVQQIHKALKTKNLTTPQAFGSPASKVLDERRQKELDKISGILKSVCDTHNLPLAQTWAVSPSSTFVSHNKVIEKSCSSFDSGCIGKACMSTTALPFHVRDVSMWHFREACRQQHLDKFRGFVGRALLSHGSCYCQDVTELSEQEYPLVHNARMSSLSSNFTIFLHSVEGDCHDYVLEFFLLLDNQDSSHVLKLVETLKHEVEAASAFELGEISTADVLGPPSDVSYLPITIKPHTIQIFSTTRANTSAFEDTSDLESFLATVSKADHVNVPSQWAIKQDHSNKQSGVYHSKISEFITNAGCLDRNDVVTGSIDVFDSRKNDNATSYPNVSTMKRDAGKKNLRLKQGRKCKINSLTMKSLEQHIGKPIGQAAKSLGVSRSTLKRSCRVKGIPTWPMPKRSNNTGYVINSNMSQASLSEKHFQRFSSPCNAISAAVFVVIGVKRWSCTSKRHGFSGKWWSCGKHGSLSSKSYSIHQITRLVVGLLRWRRESSNRHAMRCNPSLYLNTGKLHHEASIVNKYQTVDQPFSDFGLVCASSKQSVGNVLMEQMLTVKATFNDDMIKFRFPITSGLLELVNEVSQRVNVKGKRLSLKYKDEDNDLVSITCDDDLHTVPKCLATNSTIKLHVQVEDD